jgi:hypothetical protein
MNASCLVFVYLHTELFPNEMWRVTYGHDGRDDDLGFQWYVDANISEKHIVSIFRAKDGDSMCIRNVDLTIYTSPKPKTSSSSSSSSLCSYIGHRSTFGVSSSTHHFYGWKWRQYVCQKLWHLPINLHDTKTQNIVVKNILTAVQTSNITIRGRVFSSKFFIFFNKSPRVPINCLLMTWWPASRLERENWPQVLKSLESFG